MALAMPSKPCWSRTWIISSNGVDSVVDSLGRVPPGWIYDMRGAPSACLVTNDLGDRLWPTLSSGPAAPFSFSLRSKEKGAAADAVLFTESMVR